MGTQLVLSFAKRLFFNLCNALNPKPNSQTIRVLSPYRNISLFSFVSILSFPEWEKVEPLCGIFFHDIFQFFYILFCHLFRFFRGI